MFYLSRLTKLKGGKSHEKPPVFLGNYTIDFLIVAGGGGSVQAAGNFGGGGGAGGLICSGQTYQGGGGSAQTSLSFATTGLVGVTYSFTVGAGGEGGLSGGYTGAQGGNSIAFGHTAIGGGGGAGISAAGTTGGAGGGGACLWQYSVWYHSNVGTANQGYGGGEGSSTYAFGGGGGGGAASVGGAATGVNGVNGGTGGTGLAWLDGKVYCCGGRGGIGDGGVVGANAPNYEAFANNGAGGGCNLNDASSTGGTAYGADGVVILRYVGKQRGTGGTYSSAAGFSYHTFTSSGSYVT